MLKNQMKLKSPCNRAWSTWIWTSLNPLKAHNPTLLVCFTLFLHLHIISNMKTQIFKLCLELWCHIEFSGSFDTLLLFAPSEQMFVSISKSVEGRYAVWVFCKLHCMLHEVGISPVHVFPKIIFHQVLTNIIFSFNWV